MIRITPTQTVKKVTIRPTMNGKTVIIQPTIVVDGESDTLTYTADGGEIT